MINLIRPKGNKKYGMESTVAKLIPLRLRALCAKNPGVQARFLLGPAGSGKTFRCLAEIRAALAENPEGRAADLARAQTGHVPARTPVARRSLGARFQRLHAPAYFFLRPAGASSFLKICIVAPPKLLVRRRPASWFCAPCCCGTSDELKLFRGSARRPGFAQELGQLLARTATAPLHARQTPRACLPPRNCAANFATSSTTSRCSAKIMQTGCANMNCRTRTACWILRPKHCAQNPKSKVCRQSSLRRLRCKFPACGSTALPK